MARSVTDARTALVQFQRRQIDESLASMQEAKTHLHNIHGGMNGKGESWKDGLDNTVDWADASAQCKKTLFALPQRGIARKIVAHTTEVRNSIGDMNVMLGNLGLKAPDTVAELMEALSLLLWKAHCTAIEAKCLFNIDRNTTGSPVARRADIQIELDRIIDNTSDEHAKHKYLDYILPCIYAKAQEFCRG
jgi:hypothetical protein